MKKLNLNNFLSFLLIYLFSVKMYSTEFTFLEIQNESTQMHQIQKAIKLILNSNLKNNFCTLFQSSIDIQFTIGLNQNDSNIFSKNCNLPSNSDYSKFYPKKYKVFEISDNNTLSNYVSWTDSKNLTYLNNSLFESQDELTTALLHEIYMTFDVKNNLTFGTALYFKNVLNIEFNANQSENLRTLFNSASDERIAYTFAAMRGFEIENIYNNKKLISNHLDCQNQFISLLNIISKDENYLNSNNFISKLSKFNSNRSNDLSFINKVNLVLNDEIKLNSQSNITFCQFMTAPLFSNLKHLNFFSNGPRPYIGSGWDSSPVNQNNKNMIIPNPNFNPNFNPNPNPNFNPNPKNLKFILKDEIK